MEPPPVIVAFDTCKKIAFGIVAGCPSPLVDELDPERGDVSANWGRYIERTQIYAKRRPVCSGVGKHLIGDTPGLRFC